MSRSVWLGVSIVSVVVFLFWLNNKAQSLGTDVAPELAEVPAVTLEELRYNLTGAIGLEAEIGVVTVRESLGRGVFTFDLGVEGEELAYPALLSRDMIGRGTQVLGNDRITTYGHIYTLNDSIRGEWVNQSAVESEYSESIPATPSFILLDSLVFN